MRRFLGPGMRACVRAGHVSRATCLSISFLTQHRLFPPRQLKALEDSEMDVNDSEDDEDASDDDEDNSGGAAPANVAASLDDVKVNGQSFSAAARQALCTAVQARAAALKETLASVEASAPKATAAWHHAAAVTIVKGQLQAAENWSTALQ